MARQRPNRRALKTSLRNLFRRHRVRGIDHYGQLLHQTLAELAPPGVSNPCIVLLTPGVYNSAFYEHMFLAQEMGVELVQGSDLRVHNGFVYMRTTAGLKKVDVNLPPYRRRLHRPAGVPPRFAARHPRPLLCLSARQRDHRQRARHRRRPTTRASTPTCPT